MNLLSVLLLSVVMSSQYLLHLPAPSILGTWKLKSVQLLIQQPDGTPPYRRDARVTFGETSFTFTKNGRLIHKFYGHAWSKGTYRLDGSHLFIYGRENHYQEQIQELTATRLVTVLEKDEVNGLHVQVTETYVR